MKGQKRWPNQIGKFYRLRPNILKVATTASLAGILWSTSRLVATGISLVYYATPTKSTTRELSGVLTFKVALTGTLCNISRLQAATFRSQFTVVQSRNAACLLGATLKSLISLTGVKNTARLSGATFVSLFAAASLRVSTRLNAANLVVKTPVAGSLCITARNQGATLIILVALTGLFRQSTRLQGATVSFGVVTALVGVLQNVHRLYALSLSLVYYATPIKSGSRESSGLLTGKVTLLGLLRSIARLNGATVTTPLIGSLRCSALLQDAVLGFLAGEPQITGRLISTHRLPGVTLKSLVALVGQLLGSSRLSGSSLIVNKIACAGICRSVARTRALSIFLVYKATPSRRTPRLRGATVFFSGATLPLTGRLRTVSSLTGRLSTVHPVSVILHISRLYGLPFIQKRLLVGTLKNVARCHPASLSFPGVALVGLLRSSSRNQAANIQYITSLFGKICGSASLQDGLVTSIILVTGQSRSTSRNVATLHFTGTTPLSGFSFDLVCLRSAILQNAFFGYCNAGYGRVRESSLVGVLPVAMFGFSVTGITRLSASLVIKLIIIPRRWSGQFVPPPPLIAYINRLPYVTRQTPSLHVPNKARLAARYAAEEAARTFSETTH